MQIWQNELIKIFGKNVEIRLDEPLRKHTFFAIGGPAKAYFEVGKIDQLSDLIRFREDHQVPIFVLGRGSNLLISDNGFNGIVIRLTDDFDQIRSEKNRITVGTGVSQPKLSKWASKHGLSGVEFALGIPGSIGGAMIMNAGAWGSCFADLTIGVKVISHDGEILDLTADQAEFAYRKSGLDRYFCVISATLELIESHSEKVTSVMNNFYNRKITTQPFVEGSAGCMFKNPDGASAGKIIDECGLKGTRIGSAEVSQIHGNFIVNHGSATAKDVLELVALIQDRVRSKRGIELEMEVKKLGF